MWPRHLPCFANHKHAASFPLYIMQLLLHVGLQVGSIVFTAEPGQKYDKGDEMGYFAFGGSTTVALFAHNAIEFDADIMTNR